MRATKSIGILREVKNKWERRVPITPTEVKKLVDRNIRVLIQPCERRVFKDLDYKNAGAIITDDLSPSSFIIGVKDIQSNNLYENHSYLNFAHVIKGQSANMPFLDECFEKNIRLFDYECIKDPNTKLRTVAFGRFAGLAGMITGMRGLGEHLLAQGSATPFINISSCYMYSSLQDAQQQVIKIGEMITKYGLPTKYGPFVFTFTGAGNVTNGALEIFKLLPHEFVDANDLHRLQYNYDPHKVYGCILKTQHIVQHKSDGTCFEEKHYFDHPEEYFPIFHSDIAPYTRVLVNGMYWDHRYPRLLTNNQMNELKQSEEHAMIGLFDISCDPEGAVEFLKKTTNTDAPYFTYNVDLDEAVDEMDGDGVLILAVDSLPAELPKDSSEHFSNTLYPYLEALARSDSNITLEEQAEHLGLEMFNAMITWNGDYTQNFKYIEALRRESKTSYRKSVDVKSEVLKIDGHLFDSGLINQILDLIESHDAEYNILDLHSKVNTPSLQRASRLVLQIDSHKDDKMNDLITKLNTLCELNPKGQAKLIRLPFGATRKIKQKEEDIAHSIHDEEPKYKKVLAKTQKRDRNYIANERNESVHPLRNILLLGSGFVAKPVIDYLCFSGNNMITVATNDVLSANSMIKDSTYCNVISCDAAVDDIDTLVSSHDIVISLLPAHMHYEIAKSCITFEKDMVTASYISDEMKQLNDAATEANIILLNECGLDPGLDHMSVMSMIHDIASTDEIVTGFNSVCGGLPSPESANNGFGYKFSWSPMGVLNASCNDAQYLKNGDLIQIDGDRLLLDGIQDLQRIDNPYHSLSLEHVANRDSLKYISKYKLNKNEILNMYRGTLRYRGFSDIMYGCRILGLLDKETLSLEAKEGEVWSHYLYRVIQHNISDKRYKKNVKPDLDVKDLVIDILIKSTEWNMDKVNVFLQCLEYDLNIFDPNQCIGGNHKHVISAFCSLLSDKLCFDSECDERDMVLMINRISTNHNKIYESSLLVFGDDDYSAMARTVGFPVAIATQFLLNDAIDKSNKDNIGVIDATNVMLSKMVLDKAKQYGIQFKKRIIATNDTKYNIH